MTASYLIEKDQNTLTVTLSKRRQNAQPEYYALSRACQCTRKIADERLSRNIHNYQ